MRASWLRDRPPGFVLPKRGELPPEALISGAELREIYAKSRGPYKTLPVIAISHYWRTKAHFDPSGTTCAMIAEMLKKQWRSL